METRRYIIERLLTAVLATVLLSGCSLIDEDLSDCGEETEVDYELQLVTNMTTEVQTQLSAQTDLALAATVKNFLSNIFTDFAHDVILSFYSTEGDGALLHHDEHIMDGSEKSYTLYIPRKTYMHLAVANIEGDPVVRLEDTENCHGAVLRQAEGDTIDSHNTGIFTARQLMEMVEGIDQTFNVKLYMCNCSAMLVVDPNGHDISGMQVFTTGFATAFFIADSVYEYKTPSPLIRTRRMEPDDKGHVGFVSVNFPSREPSSKGEVRGTRYEERDARYEVRGTNDESSETRTVIETTEPFIAQPGDEVLWEFRVYLPQPDGTTTETILGIKEPLRAGQLKIVKVRIGENGIPESESPNVGISVTLDWKPGGEYQPEL